MLYWTNRSGSVPPPSLGGFAPLLHNDVRKKKEKTMRPEWLILVRRVRRPDGSFAVSEVDVGALVLGYVQRQAMLQGWRPPGWHMRP